MKSQQSPVGRLRAAGRVVLAAAIVLVPAVRADAADPEMTSEQVAEEILRVQDEADQTADRYMVAEQQSQDLAVEIAAARDEVSALSLEAASLDEQMGEIAVARFTGAAGSGMFFLDDPNLAMQVDALRAVAIDTGAAQLDEVESVRSDLSVKQGHLESLVNQNEQLLSTLATDQQQLNDQLTRLAALEIRLKDDEVRRAYEAKLAARRAQVVATGATQQDAVPVAAVAPRGGGSSASPPATPPTPGPPRVVAGSGWRCPVAGPTAFGDTWGAPRSGGRTHQGVDMMSPLGTPLVAVVAGFATMKTNNLGGNVVWLAGADGNKYYYAHLSSWEGGSRAVQAGEVIGYVGHTGNTAADHVHFEIHPGGGSAVNPYPTVRQYC